MQIQNLMSWRPAGTSRQSGAQANSTVVISRQVLQKRNYYTSAMIPTSRACVVCHTTLHDLLGGTAVGVFLIGCNKVLHVGVAVHAT